MASKNSMTGMSKFSALFISIVLLACEKKIDNVTNGYYTYDFKTNVLTESPEKISITAIEKITSIQGKYYPRNYPAPKTILHLKGKDYAAIPFNEGLIEIDINDSVRYLNRYNSFLAQTSGQISNIVEADDNTWFYGDEGLLRVNDDDVLKYELPGLGPNPIYGIYKGLTGIWVASTMPYLVRDRAIIKIIMPVGIKHWISDEQGGLIGYAKTGEYRVTENGIKFNKKDNISWYSNLFDDMEVWWSMKKMTHFVYRDQYFAVDPDRGKIYCLSDSGNYVSDITISKIIGVSNNGDLWGIGVDQEYKLQVAEKSWMAKLKQGLPFNWINKAAIPEFHENGGIAFLREGKQPVIVDGFKGVFKYRNDSLISLNTVNCSKMNSFLELEAIPDHKIITGIPDAIWSKHLLNKPAIWSGVVMNFFRTNADNNGIHWITDNGILLGRTEGGSVKITFDLIKELGWKIQPGDLENLRPSIGRRVFVNKYDKIHIFGKRNLVEFDKKNNSFLVQGLNTRKEINYELIFEDKDGNLWFEYEGIGIYMYNGKVIQLMVPEPNVTFWQIDSNRQLSLIKDNILVLIDMNDMVPEFNPVLASYPVDGFLSGRNILAVVWREEKPAIICNHGFFFSR